MANFTLTNVFAADGTTPLVTKVWSDPETESRPARTTGSDARQHRYYVATIGDGTWGNGVVLKFAHPLIDATYSGWLAENNGAGPWFDDNAQNELLVVFNSIGHHVIGIASGDVGVTGMMYIHFDVEAP